MLASHLLYDRVERIYREINNSILEGSLVVTLDLKKLTLVLSRFTALTGLLVYVLLTVCALMFYCFSSLSLKCVLVFNSQFK